MIEFKEVKTVFPTHLDNGALNSLTGLVLDNNYIFLNGYQYTINGWNDYSCGWYDINTLEFYREFTDKDDKEVANCLPF